MDTLIFPIFALCAIIITVASLVWTRQRADALLERWAAANGYHLTYQEPRYLRMGPYLWRRSRGQQVYYVTIADEYGRARSAYVRLGGWFLGLFSDEVDVTWDD